jgi:hypothetical protein
MSYRMSRWTAVTCFGICLLLVVFWIRSYSTIDTITYFGSGPGAYSIQTDKGTLRVERSNLVVASDRHLRFWHGRDPIYSNPSGESSFAGFEWYRVPRDGSWSVSAPVWFPGAVLLGAALFTVRARKTASGESNAKEAPRVQA